MIFFDKLTVYFSRVPFCFVFIVLSDFLIIQTIILYKTYLIFNEGAQLYQIQNYTEASQTFSEVYISLQYNGNFLQYYGKTLNLNNETCKSVQILERARHFNSDEVLYTTLGDSYKNLMKYSEAEKNYIYASTMMPQKLYPLYLLTNLYAETGQREKTIRIAKKLMNKKIKVKSTATEEILQAINLLIEKTKKKS